MAAPLTDAEKADVRRFCGYPVAGAVVPPEYAVGSLSLTTVLAGLLDVSIDTLRSVYLAPLRTMEAAFADSADGLDIKKAAVYERNLGELQERDALFANWRSRLCYFLGVPIGPGAGTGIGSESSTNVPAIFVV